MAYRIKGEWLATCSCEILCPCPVDGPPTGKDGQCRGSGVFHITEGSADDQDLTGVTIAMVYNSPSNFSSGNLKMGIVVDPGVDDAKAAAIEKIFKGEDGGPFAQFVPLIGDWLGMERAPVSYTGGTAQKRTAKIGNNSLEVEGFVGGDGKPTIIQNAMMAWRAEGYEPGKAAGKFSHLGVEYDSIYGEFSEFEFAS
jgi:hypothetical protein